MTKQERKLKKEAVEKIHKYKISTGVKTKNGKPYTYFYTVVDTNKTQKTSHTEDGLIESLFSYYFGDMDVFSMKYNNITLLELYDKWEFYRLHELHKREKTVLRDKQLFQRRLQHLPIMKKQVKDITAKHLKNTFRKIAPLMTKKEFDNVKSILNGMFQYALEELEIISSDVCSSMKINEAKGFSFLPPKNHSTEVYTPRERELILTYLENLPNQTGYTWGIRLMFCLDVRIGELKALRWSHYYPDKFDVPMIYIGNQVVYDLDIDGKHTVREMNNTKSRKDEGVRFNMLSPRALKVLEEIKRTNKNSEEILTGYILTTEAGTPIYTAKFNRKLKEVCEKVGVTYHSSHRFRNYSISEQAKTKNLMEVMYNSGHANMQTTLGYMRSASLQNQDYEQWCEIHN